MIQRKGPFAHTFRVVEREHARLDILALTLAQIMVGEYIDRMAGKRPYLKARDREYIEDLVKASTPYLAETVKVALNLNSLLVQYERHSSPAAKYLAELAGVPEQWKPVTSRGRRRGGKRGR